MDPPPCNVIMFACMDLYLQDELLASLNGEQFSLDPYQQRSHNNAVSVFELFSDRRQRCFSGYDFKPNGCIVPKETTPTINYNTLRDLLLSTDKSRMSEYETLIAGELKFLDKRVQLGMDKVALSTFCRTGNSFSRKVMEQITGVFSGADMPLIIT